MKKWIPFAIILVCIGAVLIVLYLNSLPSDREKAVDTVKDAYIILQNGDQIACTVRFVGTLYTGSKKVDIDQFSGGNDGGIWINDTFVLQHYVFVESAQPVILRSESANFYLSKDMSVFVAQMNSADLKLDVPQQNVYIVLKETSATQYEPIISKMEKQE